MSGWLQHNDMFKYRSGFQQRGHRARHAALLEAEELRRMHTFTLGPGQHISFPGSVLQ